MAEEVNNYFLDRYRSAKREEADYQNQIKRHRMQVISIILSAIAFVVLFAFVIMSIYKSKVFSEYRILKTIEYQEVTSAKYVGFNGNILRYSRDGAFAFNMNNEMLWNQTYQMQNPMVDTCGDYIAIGDYRGTKIYVLNSQGLQGQIDTTIAVQKFCVSGNGNVAVVLDDEEVTWVKLYNKNGENVASDRTTMDKSGYPVALDISDNGIMLSISYLFVDSGKLRSSVAFYNFGAVGQNEINNLVSAFNFEDEAVSCVNFINEETAFAIGNKSFAIYKGSQKPGEVYSTQFAEKIESVFYSNEYIGLVYKNVGNEGQPYRIDVYNTSGGEVASQEFDLDYTDILLNKDLIIIYNANECVIYNTSGSKKFEGYFKNSVITISSDKKKDRYLFVSGTKTDEIKFQ